MKSKKQQAVNVPGAVDFDQPGRWKYAIFFSHHVQKFNLGKARINARAVCPFHDDNDRSFSVNINTGEWRCRECGARGDLKDFCRRKRIAPPEFA